MTTEGEKSRVACGVNKYHVQLLATKSELFFKSQNSLPLSLEDIMTMMSGFTTYSVITPVTHRTGKDWTSNKLCWYADSLYTRFCTFMTTSNSTTEGVYKHRFGDIYKDIGVASTAKTVLLKSVRKMTVSVGLRQGHRNDLPGRFS
jgi:hypothetical protein